jgi:hypothetical protein
MLFVWFIEIYGKNIVTMPFTHTLMVEGLNSVLCRNKNTNNRLKHQNTANVTVFPISEREQIFKKLPRFAHFTFC